MNVCLSFYVCVINYVGGVVAVGCGAHLLVNRLAMYVIPDNDHSHQTDDFKK